VAQFLVLRVSDFLQNAEHSFERIVASAAEVLTRATERVAKQLQLFCKDVRTIMHSDDTRLETLSTRMATGLTNSLARTDARLMNLSQNLRGHVMQGVGEADARSIQKQSMLIASLRGLLKSQAQTLVHMTACLAPEKLGRLVARVDQDIEARTGRLPSLAALRLRLEEGRVETLQRLIHGYDPIHQLKLGYSILRDHTGKVVQRVEDVAVGEQLSAQVSDGFIGTKVISFDKGEQINGQGGKPDVQSSDD
jgi:exonuclease VII large subunit